MSLAAHVSSNRRPGDLCVATLTVPGDGPRFTVVECHPDRVEILTAPFDDPDDAEACSAWIAREYPRLDAEWMACGLNPIDVVVLYQQSLRGAY